MSNFIYIDMYYDTPPYPNTMPLIMECHNTKNNVKTFNESPTAFQPSIFLSLVKDWECIQYLEKIDTNVGNAESLLRDTSLILRCYIILMLYILLVLNYNIISQLWCISECMRILTSYTFERDVKLALLLFCVVWFTCIHILL